MDSLLSRVRLMPNTAACRRARLTPLFHSAAEAPANQELLHNSGSSTCSLRSASFVHFCKFSVVIPQMRILALIFALAILGCSGSSPPTASPNVTPQQQASAAKSMGLAFPSETRFLLYHRASEHGGLPGPDDAVHLKIELPASSLAVFLTQPPLSTAKWTSKNSQIADVPKWAQWQPSRIQKFRCEQFQLPKGQALNVLIDDDKDDPKVIYLFWFET